MRLSSCLSPALLVALGCGSASPASMASQDGGSTAVDTQTLPLGTDGAVVAGLVAQSTMFGRSFEVVTSADPVTAAADLTNAPFGWPATCETRVEDPLQKALVHERLNECAGPFGLTQLTGEVRVTFSAGTAGQLAAEFAGFDVTVADATSPAGLGPAVLKAHAAASIDPKERVVAWQATWQHGAGAAQADATADLDVTYAVDTRCRTASGTATSSIGGRTVTSKVDGYSICLDAKGADLCPTGRIVHKSADGWTVTMTFDGSIKATVTGPASATFSIPLACGS